MDIVTYVLAKNSANAEIAKAIAALPKGLVYRGAVSYVSDLPNNAAIGDCYTIKYKGTSGTTADGHEVAWGEYEGVLQWIDFGGGGDYLLLSGGTMSGAINMGANKITNIANGVNNGDAINLAQATELVSVKYSKPSGGIPSTDMTSAVQTSLGKADSAVQSPTSIAAVWSGTRAAYDAIATKDPNTLYFIEEE